MKNIISTLICLLVLTSTFAQRNVLTIRGMSSLSSTLALKGIVNGAKGVNFKINHVTAPIFNYDPSTGVVASTTLLNEELKKQDVTDVLGIAHDYGGIVMKNMAKTNKQLSAMILDGVPNNGSELIEKIREKDASGKSVVQKLVSDMKVLTGAEDCPTCNLETRINDFIEDIQGNSGWKDIATGSPFVGTEPNIPYAILWGNIGKKGLSSLITSYASVGTAQSNFYGNCIDEKTIAQKVKLKKAKNKATIDAIFNTYDNLKGLLNPIKITTKTGTNESSISGVSPDGVTKLIKGLITDIDNVSNASADIKKLLKCEVYVQVMNAHWDLLVSKNQVTTTQTNYLLTYDPEALQACIDNCPGTSPQCETSCYSQFGPNNAPLVTITVTAYKTRPHDGILTDIEQKLDGAAKTYELKEINHIEEIDWQLNPVNGAFIDLFNGGAGAAFVVPK